MPRPRGAAGAAARLRAGFGEYPGREAPQEMGRIPESVDDLTGRLRADTAPFHGLFICLHKGLSQDVRTLEGLQPPRHTPSRANSGSVCAGRTAGTGTAGTGTL